MCEPIQERLIFHSPNIVNLCVDSGSGEVQYGRLYHQYTHDRISFASLFEALEEMEKLYDEIQFPFAATRLRSFLPVPSSGQQEREDCGVWQEQPERGRKKAQMVESFDWVIGQKGKAATFIIRVQYRQNSSWQGEVTWTERQSKRPFRSILELAGLIEEAMVLSESRLAAKGEEVPADGFSMEGTEAPADGFSMEDTEASADWYADGDRNISASGSESGSQFPAWPQENKEGKGARGENSFRGKG